MGLDAWDGEACDSWGMGDGGGGAKRTLQSTANQRAMIQRLIVSLGAYLDL